MFPSPLVAFSDVVLFEVVLFEVVELDVPPEDELDELDELDEELLLEEVTL